MSVLPILGRPDFEAASFLGVGSWASQRVVDQSLRSSGAD